eukprot:6036024-Pyramimonas_sp.AAC.2
MTEWFVVSGVHLNWEREVEQKGTLHRLVALYGLDPVTHYGEHHLEGLSEGGIDRQEVQAGEEVDGLVAHKAVLLPRPACRAAGKARISASSPGPPNNPPKHAFPVQREVGARGRVHAWINHAWADLLTRRADTRPCTRLHVCFGKRGVVRGHVLEVNANFEVTKSSIHRLHGQRDVVPVWRQLARRVTSCERLAILRFGVGGRSLVGSGSDGQHNHQREHDQKAARIPVGVHDGLFLAICQETCVWIVESMLR